MTTSSFDPALQSYLSHVPLFLAHQFAAAFRFPSAPNTNRTNARRLAGSLRTNAFICARSGARPDLPASTRREAARARRRKPVTYGLNAVDRRMAQTLSTLMMVGCASGVERGKQEGKLRRKESYPSRGSERGGQVAGAHGSQAALETANCRRAI